MWHLMLLEAHRNQQEISSSNKTTEIKYRTVGQNDVLHDFKIDILYVQLLNSDKHGCSNVLTHP